MFFKNEVRDCSKNRADHFQFLSTVEKESRAGTDDFITINKSEILLQAEDSNVSSDSEFKRRESLI